MKKIVSKSDIRKADNLQRCKIILAIINGEVTYKNLLKKVEK